MSHTYKNIIFTNHAYNRVLSRSLAIHSVYETVNFPDKKHKKNSESTKYIKTVNNRKYQVVAHYKTDQKKYLVISAWVRGEEDTQSVVWEILTLPFKIVWFVFRTLWHLLAKVAKNIM